MSAYRAGAEKLSYQLISDSPRVFYLFAFHEMPGFCFLSYILFCLLFTIHFHHYYPCICQLLTLLVNSLLFALEKLLRE